MAVHSLLTLIYQPSG